MIVEPSTITLAFEHHRSRYATGRAWDVGYHVDLWRRGEAAFVGKSFADFEYIHEELRRVWKAFRGGVSKWDSQKTYDSLLGLDETFLSLRLRDLTLDQVGALYNLLQNVENIKTNRNGPSVVAVSKFLHFWNPRLFVIVDQGVVWDWVLRHQWVWDEVKHVRDEVDQRLSGSPCKRADAACDLATYASILIWAGQVLRDNPEIIPRFWVYVSSYEGATPAVAEYDAAAIEWFLLGLVELPPAGVSVGSGGI